jgi:hypothetical protein
MSLRFFLLWTFCFVLLHADRLHLKNGKILEGNAQEEGVYWVLKTESSTLKIKKFRVAWVEKAPIRLSEERHVLTTPPSTDTLKTETFLKKVQPSSAFQQKYWGSDFWAPDPYYYGSTYPSSRYFSPSFGYHGGSAFFGTLGSGLLSSPRFCHSFYGHPSSFSKYYRYSPSFYRPSGSFYGFSSSPLSGRGASFFYSYRNRHFNLFAAPGRFNASYRGGNTRFQIRF